MIVFNLIGGPGAGKSTASAALFVALKNKGVRAELVGEAAREVIYDGRTAFLGNQLLMLGMQYERVRRLARSGCDVAICDSPLIQNPYYGRDLIYYKELQAIAEIIDQEFTNYNVWVKRTTPFDSFGRIQKTIEEAAEFDEMVRSLFKEDIWLDITGDAEGQRKLAEAAIALIAPNYIWGLPETKLQVVM
jgi:tRNA uridine 5-carbamoylmethylation protein Kti12